MQPTIDPDCSTLKFKSHSIRATEILCPKCSRKTIFYIIRQLNNYKSILKFNSSGIRTWCTYFSGTADEEGLALTTDNLNNLYITGYTNSTDFPIQFLGGAYNQSVNGGYWDAFLLKFNNSNSLVYSSYVGGDSWDWGQSITIDNSNNVFIAGDTESSNFPVKFLVGAYNQSINGGIEDVFICKFNTSNQIIWATYYGGSNREFFLSYDNLEVDNCDNIFLSFSTIGDDSPTTSSTPTTHSNFGFDDNIACITNGYAMTYDNFIVKFSDNGGVLWDSYIGGDGNDFRTPIEIDTFNNLYVSGEWTSITNESSYPFQNQSGSYFNSTFNGYDDGYILKFKPTLAINQFQVNDENCNCTGTASVSIANGDIPYSYIWSNGVTLLNTTNTISTISGLCSGVYQVTVTSSCNQSQVMSYSITSGGMPLANISANPIIGENPLVVNYTNSSSGGTSYLWDFGNGNNANTYDVLSQTYITPGTYIVYYTTLNGSCSSKDSLIITVTDGNILIPNVFTPNGDGANDVFKVSSQFIKEFNCTIYNRWGNKLFEWSDIKTGWDGKVNNKESADGTYFYIINAKKIDGKEFKKEGAFTLIR